MGKVPPDSLKPLPEIEAALIVRGAVPVELTITDCVADVLTTVLLNAMRLELRPSMAVAAGFALIVRAVDTPAEVAVRVTVWTV